MIGLDLIMRYGSAALFMSAGGYHHHLGLNTWAGVNAPQPPDAIGLRYFTMELPKADEVGAIVDRAREAGGSIEERDEGLLLRDPFQHGVLLTAAESTSRQWKIAGDAR